MNQALLEKSRNNYEIAEISEGKKYYDVAISRFYYSLYQKINFLLREKYDKFKVSKDGKGSHDNMAEQLLEYISEECPNIDFKIIADLSHFRGLKKIRNDADYKPEMFKESRYGDEFKKLFMLCNNAVDSLM